MVHTAVVSCCLILIKKFIRGVWGDKTGWIEQPTCNPSTWGVRNSNGVGQCQLLASTSVLHKHVHVCPTTCLYIIRPRRMYTKNSIWQFGWVPVKGLLPCLQRAAGNLRRLIPWPLCLGTFQHRLTLSENWACHLILSLSTWRLQSLCVGFCTRPDIFTRGISGFI